MTLEEQHLFGLENLLIKSHTYNLKKKPLNTFDKNEKNSNQEIALLLNIIDKDFDYSELKDISRIYIPLKYFYNAMFENIISKISKSFKIYVYMPSVIRDVYSKDLDNLLKFNISGFVISHISQISLVAKYNLDIIGNYTLNIYNNYLVNNLKENKINRITFSPELDKQEIIDILNYSSLNTELIVYGKIPVMTNNYCYLGRSNKCYKECDKKCSHSSNFYLKDRMDFRFRILPDNTSCLTTIYNSKITSIKYDTILPNSIRIDILDEDPKYIQEIINTVKSGNRFEGKDYTNGKAGS